MAEAQNRTGRGREWFHRVGQAWQGICREVPAVGGGSGMSRIQAAEKLWFTGSRLLHTVPEGPLCGGLPSCSFGQRRITRGTAWYVLILWACS